jgi:thiamine transport system permease protein
LYSASSRLPGLTALGVLLLLVGAPLVALLGTAPELDPARLWRDPYLRRVLSFTVWQATLSTLLSVGLAVPVTRALARRQTFPGRRWLLRLFGLPLVIPTIVAVFGVVAVYGQQGLINRLLGGLGLPTGQFLYGLPGILIAHVFFNLPLAIRLLLPLWWTVPGETWRLASQLGMLSRTVFQLIEWPLIRQGLPGVAGLVFMLCFTSFAVVLALGGGPAATTVEVAIYQSLRFDFDPGQAVLLALLQLSCCALLMGLVQGLGGEMAITATPGRQYPRPDLAGWPGQALDGLWIGLAILGVLLPVMAVLAAGVRGPLWTVLADTTLWAAAGRSLVVALAAASLSLLGGWALLVGFRDPAGRRWRRMLELGGSLVLVVPPLVLGTGYFVLLNPIADVFALGLALVVVANALMGLPYVIRILGPALSRVAAQHGRLCESLGIHGWRRLRLVEWPLVRRQAGLALALCAALSTGDLGVIALFGTGDTTTLPLLLYQRLASYRMGEAAVTALLLLGLSLGLFVALERLIGGGRDA